MPVRDVGYETGGVVMRGRLALPDGEGPFPAVLVAPEANGLDEFQAKRAETFCELGYAAFALDYYGGGRVLGDPDEVSRELEALGSDPDAIRARARAALDVLLGEPSVDSSKVAAVGYCFGETVVMELARTGADIKVVVGFHPGLNILRPGESRNIRGKVLMCVGADDPIVPLKQRVAFEEEMRAARVDWQMVLYGGVQHSFTRTRSHSDEQAGLKFDQLASERSWRAMLDLLAQTF
ncbi:MAG TPA: dienelactone hydrolase family protein [Acidimicrobiales bacterium]|nr:dienelactone hydrolase family protein [Acidimicrobiales bacterium]